MNQTLAYLREVLSNYVDQHKIAKEMYQSLEKNHYSNEKEFAESLSETAIDYLNEILPDEINYAKEEQDHEIYEQLY